MISKIWRKCIICVIWAWISWISRCWMPGYCLFFLVLSISLPSTLKPTYAKTTDTATWYTVWVRCVTFCPIYIQWFNGSLALSVWDRIFMWGTRFRSEVLVCCTICSNHRQLLFLSIELRAMTPDQYPRILLRDNLAMGILPLIEPLSSSQSWSILGITCADVQLFLHHTRVTVNVKWCMMLFILRFFSFYDLFFYFCWCCDVWYLTYHTGPIVLVILLCYTWIAQHSHGGTK